MGCSPCGHEESDTTERLHFHFSLSCIGKGNGNPLQCSCLENPRDGGAWWAAVYGVAQSWTRLKWLSSSSTSVNSILHCHLLWILMHYTAFLISLHFFLNGFTLISSHLILFSSLSSNCFLFLFHLGHCLAVCSSFKSRYDLSFPLQSNVFQLFPPSYLLVTIQGDICLALVFALSYCWSTWVLASDQQLEGKLNSSHANFQCDFHCNIVLLKANLLQPLLPRLSEALNDGGLKQYSNHRETQR